MEAARERDIGVDVLKCVAALLITNSHMGLLYGKYAFLARIFAQTFKEAPYDWRAVFRVV